VAGAARGLDVVLHCPVTGIDWSAQVPQFAACFEGFAGPAAL